MNLVYEEGGDIKLATVQSASGSGDAESWQATSLSGKKIKLKDDIFMHLFGEKINEKELKDIKELFYSPAEIINIYVSHKESDAFMKRLVMNKKI